MRVYKCRVLCVNLDVPDVGVGGTADLADLADPADPADLADPAEPILLRWFSCCWSFQGSSLVGQFSFGLRRLVFSAFSSRSESSAVRFLLAIL